MKKFIWDRAANKKIPVRSIKDFTHPKHPSYKFFIHRMYKGEGEFYTDSFTASEIKTGCAVVNYGDTVKDILNMAIIKLSEVSPEEMEVAIAEAKLIMKGGE
jgi:hypothetical protein